jgi:transposase
MAIIRSREALVSARTQLVNHVRGAVKSFGHRLPKCPARSFHKRAAEHVPEALWPALGPILETIGSLTERIRDYERQLETISEERYPETELLRQVEGVGTLTALSFVLTLEDPHRFEKSRSVGAYLGLVPATERSGDRDPQKRISKEGDEMLRRLMVGSAHYILGPFGKDSDLRRHGEKIASRGGKNAKKRASGRWWPWRGSSRYYCIGCGLQERPTNRSSARTTGGPLRDKRWSREEEAKEEGVFPAQT